MRRPAAAAPPPGRTDVAAWEPTDSWTAEPMRAFRRRRGSGKAGLVAIIAIAVAVLVVGAGAAVWMLSDNAGGGTGKQYMADVNVSTATRKLTEAEFKCLPPGKVTVRCDRFIEGADMSVSIRFDGEDKVLEIQANGGTAAYPQDTPPAELADFFALAASLSLAGSPDQVDAARSWVKNNLRKDATKKFGGVTYDTDADVDMLAMYTQR